MDTKLKGAGMMPAPSGGASTAVLGGGNTASAGSSAGGSTAEFICSLYGLLLDSLSVRQLLVTLENSIAFDTDWEWDNGNVRRSAASAAAAKAAAKPTASSSSSSATGGTTAGADASAAATAAAAPAQAQRSGGDDVVNAKELMHYERVYQSDFRDASGNELRAWTHVSRNQQCEQWHLHSVGRVGGGLGGGAATAAAAASKHECVVRAVRDVRVDASFDKFLPLLGYRLDYEYVQKGWVFAADGGDIEVRIFQIYKFGRSGDLSTLHRLPPATAAAAAAAANTAAAAQHAAITNSRWLVELRAVCPDDRLTATQQRLVAFGKSLHPILKFSKGEFA